MLKGISPLSVMGWIWGAWAVSWLIAASWSDRAAARLRPGSELIHRIVTLVGLALLFVGGRPAHGGPLFWKTPATAGWGLVGVTLAGFALCWWARIHLGRLWSSSITRKADHHIVDTGPYALVRHPIYTGIILAAVAMALQDASLTAFVGLVLAITGYWIKARYEERFLRSQLGVEAYDSYARRTGMLFPGL